MKIDLDKKALIALVMGSVPNYDLFENPLIKDCGYFSGSYGSWSWVNYKLEKYTVEQLYKVYELCRESWTQNE